MRGRSRTAVVLSAANAEDSWLARVRVSAGVVKGTVTDARGGGNSGKGGRGWDSTLVARPRLLVDLVRMRVVTVVLCGGLTLTLVLPTRVTTAVAILFVEFLVRARGFLLSTETAHSRLPTSVRLTVVTELSEMRVQTAARVYEWVSTLLD